MEEVKEKVARIAAVGDIHFGEESKGELRAHLETIDSEADVFLIAGDLTRHGTEPEAKVLADELRDCPIPVVVVLGNHDYQSEQEATVSKVLTEADITVLEGSSVVFKLEKYSIGIAGTKGFGGGFLGACGSEFGEPAMKQFIRHTKKLSEQLRTELLSLSADVNVALLHFAPIEETLHGERLEIYPFMGSYLLGEAIDAGRCDVVFHGHAHHGTETGTTPAGVQVYNVARPVIGGPYKVYEIAIAAE